LPRGPEVSAAEVEAALGAQARAAPAANELPSALFEQPLRAAREQFERAYLEHHLQRTGGNVAEVARISEMERTNLYRKLKQLGITPKPGKD
jgi:DNA-binding NtrC family response regulator